MTMTMTTTMTTLCLTLFKYIGQKRSTKVISILSHTPLSLRHGEYCRLVAIIDIIQNKLYTRNDTRAHTCTHTHTRAHARQLQNLIQINVAREILPIL